MNRSLWKFEKYKHITTKYYYKRIRDSYTAARQARFEYKH